LKQLRITSTLKEVTESRVNVIALQEETD